MTGNVKSDAEVIDEIATELNRLSVRRIDPEAFFVERDQLVRRLRGLAKRLAPVPGAKKASTSWRPPSAAPNETPAQRRRLKTVFIDRSA